MPTIDQRVVQMQFDNKQFEQGVAQSLGSLEALKKALNLENSSKGLESMQKSLNNFDVSGVTKNIDSIASHFTVVGRFIDRHVDQILDKMTNGVKNFAKSLTVDQIGSGMSKYEQYNQSVQMIQSAMPEKSIAEIEAVLGKLNEYTDLTSYSFSEMANSIGKFVSSGVDLETSEIAMEGIANWAASAGGNVREANIAMYNLSQALSAGSVKVMDWKSIELANMATKQFKEQVIQAAISLGVLKDAGNNTGYYLKQTKKGVEQNIVTFENFRQTLSDGWFNSDVLLTVLSKYADRTDEEVGKNAFNMAKIAITWTQAVDAIKDAISTGWMNSFRIIIGNLDEAGQLFTRVSDAIIDFAMGIANWRNEVLTAWKTAGGYNATIEAAANIWHIFLDVVDLVRNALATVIPPITGEGIADLAKKIEHVTGVARGFFDLISGNTGEDGETDIKVEADLPEEEILSFSGVLKRGMSGDEVKDLQERLIQLGYTLGDFGADGKFGKYTENALKQFQSDQGLKPDGIFGDFTWRRIHKMMGETVRYAQGTLSEPYDIEPMTKTLKLGDVGDDVAALQKRLIDLGYTTEEDLKTIGSFGPKTQAALKALQKDTGIVENGIFNPQTWNELRKLAGPSSLNISPKILKLGDTGDAVADLQNELIRLGYATEEDFDKIGVYGEKTERVVKNLKKELKPGPYAYSGVFDIKTWQQLNDKVTRFNNIKEAASEPTVALENFTKMLERGAKGDEVKTLQQHLIDLGYLTDKSMADGIYGPQTEAAVKKFQKDMGIEAHGKYGYDTYNAIKESLYGMNEQMDETIDKTPVMTKVQQNMSNILAGVGAVIRNIITVAGHARETAVAVIGQVWGMITPFIGVVVDLAGTFLGLIKSWDISGKSAAFFSNIIEKITKFLKPFGDRINKVTKRFRDFADRAKSFKTVSEFWSELRKELEKDDFWKNVFKIFDSIKTAVDTAKPAIIDFYNKAKTYLWDKLQTVFSWASTNASAAFDKIANAFSTVINYVKENNVINKVLDGLLGILKAIGGIAGIAGLGIFKLVETIANGAVSTWNFLTASEKVRNVWERIQKFFSPVTNFFSAMFNSISNLSKEGKKITFMSVLSDMIGDLFLSEDPEKNKLALTLLGVAEKLESIGRWIKRTKGQIVSFFSDIYEKIKAPDDVINPIERIKMAFENLINLLKEKLGPAFSAIKNFFTFDKNLSFGENLRSKFNFLNGAIGGFVGTMKDKLLEFYNTNPIMKKIVDKIEQFVKSIRTWFVNRFGSVASFISDKILPLFSKFNDFLNDIMGSVSTYTNKTKSPIDLLIEGVTKLGNADIDEHGNFIDNIKKRFEGFVPLIEWIKGLGRTISGAVSDNNATISDIVGPNVSNAFNSILDNGKSALSWINGKLPTLAKVISGVFGGIILFNVSKGFSGFGKGIEVAGTGIGNLSSIIGETTKKFVGESTISSIIEALTKSFEKSKKDTIGTTLLKIAGFIATLVGSIALLSLIPADKTNNAIGVLVKALGSVVVSLILINKFAPNIEDIGNAVFKMSAAIGVLALALLGMVAIVTFTDPSVLSNALSIIGGLLLRLAAIEVVIRLLSRSKKDDNSAVLGLCKGLLLIALALGKVAKDLNKQSKYDKALKIVKKMLWQLAAIEIVVRLLSRKKDKTSSVLDMCKGILLLSYAISKIAKDIKKNDNYEQALNVVERILMQLVKVEVISGIFSGKSGSKFSGVVGMCAGLVILVYALRLMCRTILEYNNYETALLALESAMIAFSLSLLGVSASVKILSTIGFGGAIKAVEALGTFVLGLSGIGAILGGIDWLTNGKFGDLLADGGNTIGRAIGGFIKGITDPFKEKGLVEDKKKSLTEWLSDTINNFSGVMDDLTPFLEKAKAIKIEHLTGVKNFAKILMAMGGTEIVDTISGYISGDESGSGFVALAKDLVKLVDPLKKFSDSAVDIDIENVKHAAEVMGAMQTVITATLPMAGAEILDSIAAWAGKVVGGNDKETSAVVSYAEKLKEMVIPLAGFSAGASKVDSTAISESVAAFEALGNIAKATMTVVWVDALSNILGKVTGQDGSSLKRFVDSLNSVFPQLVLYGILSKPVDANAITSSAAALQALANVANAVPGADGLFQKVFGEHDIENFGSKLKTLGEGLSSYYSSTKDIPSSYNPSGGIHALEGLAGVARRLPRANGVLQQLVGEKSLSDFSEDIKTLGKGLYVYATLTDKIPSNYDSQKSISVLNALSELESGLREHGGWRQMITGDAKLSDFGSEISQLGTDLATLDSKIKGIKDYEKLKGFGDALVSLNTAFKTAPYTGDGVWNITSMIDNIANNADFTGLSTISYKLVKGLADGITTYGTTDSPPGKMRTVMDDIRQSIYDASNDFIEAGKSIVTSIISGVKDNSDDAKLRMSILMSAMKQTGKTFVQNGTFKGVGTDIVTSIIVGIQESTEAAKLRISILMSAMKQAGRNFIQNGSFKGLGTSICSAIANGIKESDAPRTAIVKVITGLVKQVRNTERRFVDVAAWIDHGLAQGIRDNVWRVEDAVTAVANAAITRFCQESVIQSPSRVFAWAGQMLDMGIVKGLESYSSLVGDASASVADEAIDSVKEGLGAYSNNLVQDLDATPTIRPVLDLSEVESGLPLINGLFGGQTIGVRSAGLAGTINRRDEEIAEARVNASEIGLASSIQSLNDRVNELGERISNLKVYMNGSALVGQILPDVDRGLGRIKVRR